MKTGFENLEVWKRSCVLCAEIYKYFRNNKDYGFKDQITRSSLSIPSNISEGYERSSKKEKNRFYTIARASTGELRTQIMIGIKIDYIDKEIGSRWILETRELSAMITGLMNSTNAQ